MKTRLLITSILLCVLSTTTAYAQSTDWYISAAAGINMYQGEDDANIGLYPDRYTISPVLTIGGWFTPSIGMQGTLCGGPLKGLSLGKEPYSIKPNPGLFHAENPVTDPWEERWNYLMLQLEATCNFSNAMCGCNPDRIWNVIGHAGLQLSRSFGNGHHCNSLGAVLGFSNSWKVADHVDLFLDGSCTIFGKQFDQVTYRNMIDDMLTLKVGVTINLEDMPANIKNLSANIKKLPANIKKLTVNLQEKIHPQKTGPSISDAYRMAREQDSSNHNPQKQK